MAGSWLATALTLFSPFCFHLRFVVADMAGGWLQQQKNLLKRRRKKKTTIDNVEWISRGHPLPVPRTATVVLGEEVGWLVGCIFWRATTKLSTNAVFFSGTLAVVVLYLWVTSTWLAGWQLRVSITYSCHENFSMNVTFFVVRCCLVFLHADDRPSSSSSSIKNPKNTNWTTLFLNTICGFRIDSQDVEVKGGGEG